MFTGAEKGCIENRMYTWFEHINGIPFSATAKFKLIAWEPPPPLLPPSPASKCNTPLITRGDVSASHVQTNETNSI